MTKEGGWRCSRDSPSKAPLSLQLPAPFLGGPAENVLSGLRMNVYDLGLGKSTFSKVDRGPPLPPDLKRSLGRQSSLPPAVVGAVWASARLAASAFETKGTAACPLWKSGVLGSTCGLQTSEGAGGEWTVPPARPQEEIPLNKAALTNQS